MRRFLTVSVVVGLVWLVGVTAYAADYESVVLDFEDLWDGTTDHGSLQRHYHDLYWPNTAWCTRDSQPDTGHYYTFQGNVGIYSWSTMAIRSYYGPFSLMTARLGSACMDNMLVHVEADRDHQRVYDFWITLSAYGSEHTLNLCNVDIIRFNPLYGSGTPVFPGHDEGWAVVADNLEIVYGQIPPPVADAGPDQTVEQTSPAGAEVTLDGSASDAGVSHEWSVDGAVVATGAVALALLPPGLNTVELTVTDELGLQGTDECVVTVQDTTPPTGVLTVLQSELTPPRGKDRLVLAAVVSDVADACDPQPTITVELTSNQPLEGPDDGGKHPDYQVIDDGTTCWIWLRAESEGGTAREYYVSVTLADSAGNTAELGPETIAVAGGKGGKGPKKPRGR